VTTFSQAILHFIFKPVSSAWRAASLRLLLSVSLLLSMAPPVLAATDTIDITQAHLEMSDDGYRLSASYSFDLNRELEVAIHAGVPLYFTTRVEVTRARWYWLAEKTVETSRTTAISYNPLTSQYRVSIIDRSLGGGRVNLNFKSLEEALFSIRRPSRWVVAPRGALKSGDTYNVSLQMGLDLEYLPTPIQVNSLNNSGWRLSSRNKNFLYRAE
jgi:hypothetical protein